MSSTDQLSYSSAAAQNTEIQSQNSATVSREETLRNKAPAETRHTANCNDVTAHVAVNTRTAGCELEITLKCYSKKVNNFFLSY